MFEHYWGDGFAMEELDTHPDFTLAIRVNIARKYNTNDKFSDWIKSAFSTLCIDAQVDTISDDDIARLGTDFYAVLLCTRNKLHQFKARACVEAPHFLAANVHSGPDECMALVAWTSAWAKRIAPHILNDSSIVLHDVPQVILDLEGESGGYKHLCHACVVETVDAIRWKGIVLEGKWRSIVDRGIDRVLQMEYSLKRLEDKYHAP